MTNSYSKGQVGGILSLIAGTLFLTAASYVNEQAFNVYYEKITTLLGISETLPTTYLLNHPELGHIVCYGLLTWITFLTLQRSYILAFTIPVGIGICLELLQHYSTTRTPSIHDVCINMLGSSLMLVIIYLGQRFCSSPNRVNTAP